MRWWGGTSDTARDGGTGGESGTGGRTVAGPAVRDTALWLALAGVALVWFVGHPRSSVALELVLPLAVLAVAIPARRRWPVAAAFAVNALCAIGLAHPVTPANAYIVALAVSAYLLGTGATTTRSALRAFGGCLALDLALCAALGGGAVWWYYTLTAFPLALLVPWLFGRYWQAQLAFVRGGWQRAQLLERQQRLVAEQARLRERTRIAADMHDSLGHELSLIALRAGALELSPTLTGRDRADLGELRAAVSDAVGHLRDTVGVLRDAEGDRAATPADESVEELVDRARGSGVTVDLRREGTPAPPGLSPLVDRAVHRVVREALTNAAKHAPGGAVRVRIAHEGGRTDVRVTNSGGDAGKSHPPSGPVPGGHGLTGLRERVEVVGGTLRAAPRGTGFEVAATMPDRVGQDRPLREAVADSDTGSDTESREWEPESESVRQLTTARRRARLRFAAAFVVPGGFGLITLGSAAYAAFQLATCVLRPADYAQLHVGADRAEFANVLPARQFPYVSDSVKARPRPAGTTCAYYRSSGSLLDQVDVYRLCYSGSRLVSKDVVPGSGRG
ncbi:sensor histidine kinase [Streptomyces sp. NP-1717]|uniref:sensor histidine kinase n=1 Tax=Streptomyces sp. NP-1717 TaxID=2704470 RepID=UPI001F5D84FA|nr:histidine kinase [Streptomyces sp. NP-1717]